MRDAVGSGHLYGEVGWQCGAVSAALLVISGERWRNAFSRGTERSFLKRQGSAGVKNDMRKMQNVACAYKRVTNMYKRMKIPFLSLMFAVSFINIVPAQEAEQDRDPFFGERPRSSATSTSQDGGEWGRDPFTKPFEGTALAPATRAPEKKLTGIIYGKDVRIAIIGGEMVREGSMVGDRKLTNIRQRSIVLMNSTGGNEEIFLENFSVRK